MDEKLLYLLQAVLGLDTIKMKRYGNCICNNKMIQYFNGTVKGILLHYNL